MKFIVLVGLIFCQLLHAADTCSRIAIVNYQEILVDPSTTSKGDGLRYYLEKDEKAKLMLDEYQANNAPKWQSSALSSVGSILFLGGILRSNSDSDEGITSRSSLMITGATFITLSYLISRTVQYKNEFILSGAIEEYNKRNLPRIFFNPFDPITGSSGAGVGISKDF
jgi:hypothetical protein